MSDNYIIVRGYDISNLQKQVNDKIKDGYIPVGGIFAKEFNYVNYSKKLSSSEVFQSMMKEKVRSGVNNY